MGQRSVLIVVGGLLLISVGFAYLKYRAAPSHAVELTPEIAASALPAADTQTVVSSTELAPNQTLPPPAPLRAPPVLTNTPALIAKLSETRAIKTKVELDTNTANLGSPLLDEKEAEQESAGPLPGVESKQDRAIPEGPLFWIWLGAGASYLSASQSAPGVSSLDFDKLKAPTFLARGGFYFSERFGLDFTYKNGSGDVKSSDTLMVRNGEYQRSELSSEVLMKDLFGLNQQNRKWGLRLGLRRHQLPFLVPQGTTDITVIESTLTNASIGIDYSYPLSFLRLDWQLRYQHPLNGSAQGATLEYKPQFNVDASVGAVREFHKNWKAGIYWYGEWQQNDFSYRNDTLTQDYTGSIKQTFNNVDLRVGMEF